MRESADLSFGRDDGTVYAVDIGTERLADILGVREMDAAPLLDTGAIDRI